MRLFAIIALLFAAACSPLAETTEPPPAQEALPVPPDIAAAVDAAMPGVAIMSGATDGQGEYEVTGALNGQEYEFDLLGPEGGWRVTEIQREIAWGDTPAPVRNLIATMPNTFLPERVIESRQTGDESVIYVLSSPSASEAIEVRLLEGEAAIMPPAH